MSFIDSSTEVGFSYRHRYHFCVLVTGKFGSRTDDTVVKIALIMEHGASSRSSSDKLHVFPRRADVFAVYLMDTICGTRSLEPI